MAKLIYLGKELDNSEEHNLQSYNEFGFSVTVMYTKESWMSTHQEGQTVDTFNNVTQVHYMFEHSEDGRIHCAFESDILSTGCYRKIALIESITIELATEKAKDFGCTDVILPDGFREQLEKEFIPAIERMVEKQAKHIEFLRKSANKIKYRRYFFNASTSDIDDMISGAERLMNHLQGRLAQYKEYAEKSQAETSK